LANEYDDQRFRYLAYDSSDGTTSVKVINRTFTRTVTDIMPQSDHVRSGQPEMILAQECKKQRMSWPVALRGYQHASTVADMVARAQTVGRMQAADAHAHAAADGDAAASGSAPVRAPAGICFCDVVG